MESAPGMDFLPIDQQQLFAHEFQKDVEFLEFLILMVSKSCATGSVDITWMDGNDGLRPVIGTTQAARLRARATCNGPAGSEPALLQRGERLWPARRRIVRRLRKCGGKAGRRKRPRASVPLPCGLGRYRGARDRRRASHRDALQRAGAE